MKEQLSLEIPETDEQLETLVKKGATARIAYCGRVGLVKWDQKTKQFVKAWFEMNGRFDVGATLSDYTPADEPPSTWMVQSLYMDKLAPKKRKKPAPKKKARAIVSKVKSTAKRVAA